MNAIRRWLISFTVNLGKPYTAGVDVVSSFVFLVEETDRQQQTTTNKYPQQKNSENNNHKYLILYKILRSTEYFEELKIYKK
jgi:hypothetical protein